MVNRPWLCYSIKSNGIYCIHCVFFCDSSESPFVTRNWKKALGKKLVTCNNTRGVKATNLQRKEWFNFFRHASLVQILVLCYQSRLPNNSYVLNIGSLLSEQVAKQQLRTKRGILSIIDIILVLGQRGIPFRGNWDRKEKSKDGNFFFINWKSTFHKNLKEHVQHSADNAKYTSPKILN